MAFMLSTTAAAQTGPKSAPLPTSSIRAILSNPCSKANFSKVRSQERSFQGGKSAKQGVLISTKKPLKKHFQDRGLKSRITLDLLKLILLNTGVKSDQVVLIS